MPHATIYLIPVHHNSQIFEVLVCKFLPLQNHNLLNMLLCSFKWSCSAEITFHILYILVTYWEEENFNNTWSIRYLRKWRSFWYFSSEQNRHDNSRRHGRHGRHAWGTKLKHVQMCNKLRRCTIQEYSTDQTRNN